MSRVGVADRPDPVAPGGRKLRWHDQNYAAIVSLTEATDRRRARWRVRRLAAARVVSSGGSQAAQLALIYQIYAITRSGAWVAAALFGSISLGGLLGPISGWVADRFDRRRVMVLSELTSGATYLSMVFAHTPGLLLAGALAATVLGAPFRAASAAAIPNLVSAEDLAWANAQLGAAFNVALVAGPLVGGALVAISGASLVFAVNAATFAISGALIAFTSGVFGGHQKHLIGEAHATRELFAGFRLIVSNKRLAPLAVASALAFGSFGAALVIDPALSRYFHAGSVGYGLLTTVWGAGAVVGALVAGRVVTVPRAHKAVVWGMAAMAISLGSIVVLPTFALIVAAGAVGGAGSGFVFIPWLLLIQHHSTDAIRGRVVAAAEAFDQIAFLVGMGAAVPVISITGPHQAYALAGLLLTAATIITAVSSPRRPAEQPSATPTTADDR
jgi:MFS family permease